MRWDLLCVKTFPVISFIHFIYCTVDVVKVQFHPCRCLSGNDMLLRWSVGAHSESRGADICSLFPVGGGGAGTRASRNVSSEKWLSSQHTLTNARDSVIKEINGCTFD